MKLHSKIITRLALFLFLISPAFMSLNQILPQEKSNQETEMATEQEKAEPESRTAQNELSEPAETESLWMFIYRGGVTMFALGVISVLILAFAIERTVFFRREKISIKGFYPQMMKTLSEGGLDALEKSLSDDSRLIARVLHAGIQVRGQGRERMERAIVNSSTIELGKLEKGLNLLNNLGNLAPLLGFFGTVMGMRHSFMQFVVKAAPTAKDLAGGVEEALITTIAGLFIAIPAYLIYNLFLYYIDNVTIEIEKCANVITDRMN